MTKKLTRVDLFRYHLQSIQASWKNKLDKLIRIAKNTSFKGSNSELNDMELLGNFKGSLKVKNLFKKKQVSLTELYQLKIFLLKEK